MKKKFAVLTMMFVFLAAATVSNADRFRRGQSDNPLRLIGYVAHPIGLAAEYAVMRPIHWVVSQPYLDVVFGHKATVEEDGTYFEFLHGDYSPSIAVERRAIKNSGGDEKKTEDQT